MTVETFIALIILFLPWIFLALIGDDKKKIPTSYYMNTSWYPSIHISYPNREKVKKLKKTKKIKCIPEYDSDEFGTGLTENFETTQKLSSDPPKEITHEEFMDFLSDYAKKIDGEAGEQT